MKEDLQALMITDIGLAGLCSGRVYWAARPQGDPFPAIVLHMISNVPRYTYRGEGSAKLSRVQCDLYACSYIAADTFSTTFKNVVSGFRGEIGATSFTGIFIEGWRESVDPGQTDAERLFRVSIDLMINHKEI